MLGAQIVIGAIGGLSIAFCLICAFCPDHPIVGTVRTAVGHETDDTTSVATEGGRTDPTDAAAPGENSGPDRSLRHRGGSSRPQQRSGADPRSPVAPPPADLDSQATQILRQQLETVHSLLAQRQIDEALRHFQQIRGANTRANPDLVETYRQLIAYTAKFWDGAIAVVRQLQSASELKLGEGEYISVTSVEPDCLELFDRQHRFADSDYLRYRISRGTHQTLEDMPPELVLSVFSQRSYEEAGYRELLRAAFMVAERHPGAHHEILAAKSRLKNPRLLDTSTRLLSLCPGDVVSATTEAKQCEDCDSL
jgi:hypothetical protein